jgi:hypothetical protein
MCSNNEECPRRGKCYRAMAEFDPFEQAFSDFYEEDVECEHFWPIRERREG